MSDFMKWLYVHYIKPYVSSMEPEEYELPLSLLDGELLPQQRADYEKALEFTALHAFSLGLRTGAGLTPAAK